MEKEFNLVYDPDFSEYNPILAELKELKEVALETKKSFFKNLFEKLSYKLVAQID